VEQSSAKERILKAFFELLREKPYNKITVSAIISTAHVNRSTFYRYYENVEDLMECATEELTQIITPAPPFQVTDADTLEKYSNIIFDLAKKHSVYIGLLSGENGKVSSAYRIANAIRDRLEEEKQKAGIDDPGVERCIRLSSPTLSFYFKAGNTLYDGNYYVPDAEIEFDPSCSMLQNVSRLLAKRRGGTHFFHYDLLCAYVILDSKGPQNYRDISVSQLLATAGTARTEFYKYYKNIEDFFEAFEDACVHCALYWLTGFIKAKQFPDEEDLNVFANKEAVRISIQKFFSHGRITDYFPRIMRMVLGFLNSHIPGGIKEDELMTLLYYLVEFAYAICSYLAGLTDYSALKKTLDHLQTVRIKYGI